MSEPLDPRRRWAAIGALAGGAASLLAVLVFLLDAPLRLLATLLLLAVAIVAGWHAVAHRGNSRLVGAGVAVLAVLLALVVTLRDPDDTLGMALALALGVASVGAARYATRRRADSLTAAELNPRHPPARHGVLLINPRSGDGAAARHGIEAAARARGVRPIVLGEGDDLRALAEGAVQAGADVLGMAGGDGSQALVADVARAAGLPLVVVPAGTRNHFALDLGLDRSDVVGALDAFTQPVSRTVDLARVNDRIFVNNASLGLYAEIVSSEDYRDAKLRTALDALPDLVGPDAEAVDLLLVDSDGSEHDGGQVVLVSNNAYTFERLGALGTRERLDRGTLGVANLTLASAADARDFLVLQTAHLPGSFPGWQEWATPGLEVRSASEVAIALDGEALTMAPPLRFESLPGALTVLLPDHAPGRSPAARSMGRETPAELWALARGFDPSEAPAGR